MLKNRAVSDSKADADEGRGRQMADEYTSEHLYKSNESEFFFLNFWTRMTYADADCGRVHMCMNTTLLLSFLILRKKIVLDAAPPKPFTCEVLEDEFCSVLDCRTLD